MPAVVDWCAALSACELLRIRVLIMLPPHLHKCLHMGRRLDN
jgi:hypothetical protein